MTSNAWLCGVLLALAGCPGGGGTGGAGSGTTGSAMPGATTCDGLRPKVDALYRAEAQAKEPKRVDEAVADNTAMVLADCNRAPDRVVACVNAITSVSELESRCLAPLDDEGTEGDALRK